MNINILHKMTGQSCAAVCVVLCVLAATAHSFSFNGVPSAYDDDVPPAYDDDVPPVYDNDNGRCFIILSLMATSFGIVALMNLTCIQHQISYIIEYGSTLYVGMTQKKNGGPIKRVQNLMFKTLLWM